MRHAVERNTSFFVVNSRTEFRVGNEAVRTTDSQLKSTTRTSLLYIYSIPPDDGLQICPKHVQVD